MESRSTDLAQLREALERGGEVVVPHGDARGEYLCVRLPLFASVRIRTDGRRLHLEPRSGPLGQTTNLLLTGVASAGAVGGMALALGAHPMTWLAAAVAVAAHAHEVCRFVVTEGCRARIQRLVVPSPAPLAAGNAQAAALDARSPARGLPAAGTPERGVASRARATPVT